MDKFVKKAADQGLSTNGLKHDFGQLQRIQKRQKRLVFIKDLIQSDGKSLAMICEKMPTDENSLQYKRR